MLSTRRSLLLMLPALVLIAGTGSLAVADHCGLVRCPECGNNTCVPTPTTVKEKKTVYSCECKNICIPSVKGPFAPCCEPPGCGRVRTIKVLKKTEIECEKCGYKWDVKSCDCCK